MDQASGSNNVPVLTPRGSCTPQSTDEVTHQNMALQQMYRDIKNSLTPEQAKSGEIVQRMETRMANLQKMVAKMADDNTKQKKSYREESEDMKKQMESLRSELQSFTTGMDAARIKRALPGENIGDQMRSSGMQMQYLDDGLPSEDQAGPSRGLSTTTSYLSFTPEEYMEFKGRATHQIMELQRMYRELGNSFIIEQSKTQERTRTLDLLKEQTSPIAGKMANLQKIIAKITDENARLKRDVSDQDDATKILMDEKNVEMQTLKTMIESLARNCSKVSSRNGAALGTNSDVPVNISEICELLEQQLGCYDVKLSEADLRFQILETTNYNGEIIWKIQDFRRRRDDAKRGGALSIYSQPFYTSRYGYKMCLHIYLNGDGMGRNTHISLYFVLMKGEYDAVLSFPFRQKVTLFMLDQSPLRRHHSDTFRPDPASCSFKKPNSDMNIASGCPMFVAHDAMENGAYVVDDAIFIRAVIDTTDLENL